MLIEIYTIFWVYVIVLFNVDIFNQLLDGSEPFLFGHVLGVYREEFKCLWRGEEEKERILFCIAFDD